jgi:hypothetical protein
VLEQALHLCFGLDPKDADAADTLRNDADGADSLGRNYQWQAAQLKKKLEQLESVTEPEKSADELRKINERHSKLVGERDDAEREALDADQARADADLQFAKATADVATLAAEYDRAFSEYLRGSASPAAHPLVKQSIEQQRCGLCGTAGSQVVEVIKAKVGSASCPLCDSATTARVRKPDALKKVDSALAEAKANLTNAMAKRERLIANSLAATGKLNSAVAALDGFERKYSTLIEAGEGQDGSRLQRTIAGYREQIAGLLARSQKEREKRDRKRKELAVLRRKLLAQYSEAEERFVPILKDLAHSFLGIGVDVRMDQRAGGVSLALTMDDTLRRKTFQLSESQRFFVDIALRMALLKFTSPEYRTACLLVDTPEGALDIAYEKRAGDMFAKFVLDGFNLIFTANINTSQLLQSLALNCGKSHMRLHRMTSWTPLSEVQQAEETLFESAYEYINAALAKGPAHRGPATHG